jgi:hypothetical protein
LRAFRRHVLEIEGGAVDATGEFRQRSLVAVVANHHRRELAGTGIGHGIHHQEAQPQRRAGKRQHAGQLPAAQDSYRGHERGSGTASTSSVCLRTERGQGSADALVFGGEQGSGKQRRIRGAGRADRKGRHRDTGRHLHDRQQRIEPVQRLRLHRHAQHRHRGLRRQHPGQVRGTTGTGDDGAQPARAGLRGVVEQQVRGAMRRHHAYFMRDSQRLKPLRRVLHRLPVRTRAHDHADARIRA